MRARGESRPVSCRSAPSDRVRRAALACLLAAAVLAPAARAQQTSAPWAPPAAEPRLTTVRMIRAGEILGHADLELRAGPGEGLRDAEKVAGLEARVNLFPGRPIGPGDIGPPAAVERNAIVTLRFQRGNLLIEGEGRALDRGAEGARIRVMNLLSRATVIGRVTGKDLVEVGG